MISFFPPCNTCIYWSWTQAVGWNQIHLIFMIRLSFFQPVTQKTCVMIVSNKRLSSSRRNLYCAPISLNRMRSLHWVPLDDFSLSLVLLCRVMWPIFKWLTDFEFYDTSFGVNILSTREMSVFQWIKNQTVYPCYFRPDKPPGEQCRA